MNVRDPAECLALLDEIADEADAIALRLFRSSGLRVDQKPDETPVTEADRGVESTTREIVSRQAPDLGVLGEEEGEIPGVSGARLIIDPIDATRNFVRGIPIFATLLAVEVKGEVVAGVVSAPALYSRWRAARGIGAFEGPRKLTVSPIAEIEEAQLFHGNLEARSEEGGPPGLPALMRRVLRTRGFGDFYQHALVAEGAGEVAIDPAVMPWDIAPLQVIVEEAGGRATTLTGERSIYGGSLVTTNGVLHDECLQALAGAEWTRAV